MVPIPHHTDQRADQRAYQAQQQIEGLYGYAEAEARL